VRGTRVVEDDNGLIVRFIPARAGNARPTIA